MEHAVQVRHDGIQIEYLRLKDLLAAEREELACETGRALAGLLDLLDMRADGILGSELHHRELAVAEYGSEQVVEVVRHASRQPSHRLHLLSLAELLFALAQSLLRLTTLRNLLEELLGPFLDPRLELRVGLAQREIALVDLGEHFIEGVGQRAELVVALLLDADSVVPVRGNCPGRFGETLNRPGDRALKRTGKKKGE